MIRDLMKEGLVKEYHRSISIDRLRERDHSRDRGSEHGGTPRHLIRSSSKGDYWIHVLIGLLILSVTVSLALHFHPISAPPPSFTVEGGGDRLIANTIAVHVAYLAVNIVDLQEKVAKASLLIQEIAKRGPPTVPSSAVAELKLERMRTSSLLVEISTGLDAMANLLIDLKESGLDITKISTGRDAFDKFSKNGIKNVKEILADIPTSDLMGVEMTGSEEGGHPADSNPLYDFFEREEIREYIKVRPNREGRKNFMGVNVTYGAIGRACVSNKKLLEKYMDYDIGEYCRDDWVIAQQLMIRGCEPLPRRRCRARGPKKYSKPLPANASLWTMPSDENIRWNNYFCQNFSCLSNYKQRKKFFKCSPCFDLDVHERLRWVVPNAKNDTEFLIIDVLAIKPGEVRIGLDYSMGTGTFAARMKEHNVTIASTTLNLGAPFSETIALRGLLPLYVSINQRLPFFDNTLDLVHTTLFLDGWIDHQLLDFILYDFDRVLRPGGLLWLDRFFCAKDDLPEYLFYFKRLQYKVHKWLTLPKMDEGKNQVYFSAVWEKPPSPY